MNLSSVFEYDECIACRVTRPTEILMPCLHLCLCYPCLCPICRCFTTNIEEPLLIRSCKRLFFFVGYWGTIVYFSYCWYIM